MIYKTLKLSYYHMNLEKSLIRSAFHNRIQCRIKKLFAKLRFVSNIVYINCIVNDDVFRVVQINNEAIFFVVIIFKIDWFLRKKRFYLARIRPNFQYLHSTVLYEYHSICLLYRENQWLYHLCIISSKDWLNLEIC